MAVLVNAPFFRLYWRFGCYLIAALLLIIFYSNNSDIWMIIGINNNIDGGLCVSLWSCKLCFWGTFAPGRVSKGKLVSGEEQVK